MPSIYQGNNAKVGNYLLLFGIFMFFVFVGCAAFILVGHKEYPKLSIALGAAWIIAVPVYFFFEHVFIFKNTVHRTNMTNSSEFKTWRPKFGPLGSS